MTSYVRFLYHILMLYLEQKKRGFWYSKKVGNIVKNMLYKHITILPTLTVLPTIFKTEKTNFLGLNIIT